VTRPARYWDPEADALSWADTLRWQGAQLAPFLERIAASPFYAPRLAGVDPASITEVAALDRLPFTSKDELRASQAAATREAPFGAHQVATLSDIVQTVSSSGTSGRPAYYGLTVADCRRWTDTIANTWFTAGLRAEDTVGQLINLTMMGGGLPFADGLRALGANLVWPGGLSTSRVMATIEQLRVTAINATPSFALYLTDHCRELTGREPRELGVRKLVGGGEPGLGQPEIRQRLREAWGLVVARENMGLSDVLPAMWAECDAEDGMHFVAGKHVVVELIDPITRERLAWREGAVGEPVYTTFTRDATPVLRFRSSDRVVVRSVRCRCGRGGPAIRCIGRTDDMLIYKAMNVFPTAIRDVVLRGFGDRVRPDMRIRKDSPDQVHFLDPMPLEVELAGDLSAEESAGLAHAIEEAVRTQLQVRVAVELRETGSISGSHYKRPLVYVRPDTPA
jgi:phenylacetate-coenzyme A ligase PaaK-like adenylate-forming protein